MKWFMAQVCAIAFCIGMQPPALFALGFDQQGTATADLIDRTDPLSAVQPQESIAPGPAFYAGSYPSGVNGSAPDAYAAQHLFGACGPEWQGQDCFIDPGTMSVTYGSRLYPAIPMSADDPSEIAMTHIGEASNAEPVPASLVVIGLGLVIIAFMRRRKRRASLGRGSHALPLTRSQFSPGKLDRQKEDKARSLAA